jgi:hypothetical protein
MASGLSDFGGAFAGVAAISSSVRTRSFRAWDTESRSWVFIRTSRTVDAFAASSARSDESGFEGAVMVWTALLRPTVLAGMGIVQSDGRRAIFKARDSFSGRGVSDRSA